ncbi:7-carboxy-7-deazaguanine synthase QueE [Ancylothrix sp. C2]|uniref:7-carboxy-7-deazaguanine synthase QueE n=1 Tax=Ancylothrix sp. D3o TaxID=2953691 RepID=UPI0021BB14BE|nr:7-carboxy-7-deazaguanine synthase QueE [Ancylothrix sp. D3o]MCT7950141.1 7-carboxy-7-deazaguanine synthase QueE [Ancylothrix sp. D3o]
MQVGSSKNARLIEVFSAIQGEALNIGTRQIFIRFAICDLRCSYCDSAHTWQVPAQVRIERTPGLRDFEFHANPVQISDLLTWVERQNQPGLHDSISLTGGEPLLHAPFLVEFLPLVKRLTGLPIYLETGGHRPTELAMVLHDLDSVGMDIKLPSVSGESHWEAHRQFLQLCVDAEKEVFVKIIISSETVAGELEKAAELVAAVSEKVPVYLQPVTPLREEEKARMKGEKNDKLLLAPSPEQVLQWQGLMKRYLKQVRVIPQTHKMLNQL